MSDQAPLVPLTFFTTRPSIGNVAGVTTIRAFEDAHDAQRCDETCAAVSHACAACHEALAADTQVVTCATCSNPSSACGHSGVPSTASYRGCMAVPRVSRACTSVRKHSGKAEAEAEKRSLRMMTTTMMSCRHCCARDATKTVAARVRAYMLCPRIRLTAVVEVEPEPERERATTRASRQRMRATCATSRSTHTTRSSRVGTHKDTSG